jgi:DNA-binding LytR/AlgR family response regulator
MKKLRCIAIDDEPFALEIMADDIGRIPFLELVGRFSSPLNAWELVKRGEVDLLFLDIQMPTLTGIQFLRSQTWLGKQTPMVILTTAYEQYALEGFELDVVDYLLKPIPFERLLKAASKAQELFLLRQGATAAGTTSSVGQRTFFFIFSEYNEIRIFHDEVLYVEGLKD